MKNIFKMKCAARPLAFCLLAALLLAGTALGEVSREGLVGEWHFDGDAKDSSGNGNDGTIYGATFVDGKVGKALSFDGMDDYVRVLDSPTLDVIDGITIEAWVKLSSTSSNGQVIAHKWGDEGTWSDSRSYGLNIPPNTKKIEFPISDLTNQLETPFHRIATTDIDVIELGKWHYVAGTFDGTYRKIYVDSVLVKNVKIPSNIYAGVADLGIGAYIRSPTSVAAYFNGLIDEVRIYNRALSAEEIKAHYEQGSTELIVKKEVSLYSIRQYQTSNVTVQIKNTGTSEIRDIEVTDLTNSNLELIGGDFPNPKKYKSLNPGESRDIRYILKSKESGTFILNPATVSYSDNTGNIKVVKSEPVSLIVIPSSEGSPEISSPYDIGSSSAVLLHGEKTDVVLGEDILLKLSAVNLITKPPMSVQVMIYPPSGMSVTGSEFVVSGAGIYTTKYTLNPGDGKDIEVHIKSNQIGDFNVKGRIVYYFGEEKDKAEDHTLNLPIKVRKEPGPPAPLDQNPKAPGFAGEFAIIGILFVVLIIKRRRCYSGLWGHFY